MQGIRGIGFEVRYWVTGLRICIHNLGWKHPRFQLCGWSDLCHDSPKQVAIALSQHVAIGSMVLDPFYTKVHRLLATLPKGRPTCARRYATWSLPPESGMRRNFAVSGAVIGSGV